MNQIHLYFDSIVIGKEKILILIEDENNNVFGCYINSKIDKNRNVENEFSKGIEDPNCFIFSFRNNEPTKYGLRKDRKDDTVFLLYEKKDERLFIVGERDIFIRKSNRKSFCCDDINDCKFDYQGKQKVLNGKSGMKTEDEFKVKRILVIQME